MNKIALISVAILTTGLITGCATSSDIDNLQSQIDDLNGKVSSAETSAADAAASAKAAEDAANRAASSAEDTNNKLDRMFKKSMQK